jgi:hypothetical protein
MQRTALRAAADAERWAARGLPEVSVSEGLPKRQRRSWLGIFIATVLGIAATVGVGWYQLVQAEKQAILAEDERARSVRANLVSIVEEHVLNDEPIDLSRLSRLIDHRRREERVRTPISVRDLLETAEFNVLGSRYLAFDRKNSLKVVFDSLYADLGADSLALYGPEVPNADLLNEIGRAIQEGKAREAGAALQRLQEAHFKDVEDARAGRHSRSGRDVLSELLDEPLPLLLTALAYVVLAVFFLGRRRDLVLKMARVFLGLGFSPGEVDRRIARYRGNGMSDSEIVDRLTTLGAPRSLVERRLKDVVDDAH